MLFSESEVPEDVTFWEGCVSRRWYPAVVRMTCVPNILLVISLLISSLDIPLTRAIRCYTNLEEVRENRSLQLLVP